MSDAPLTGNDVARQLIELARQLDGLMELSERLDRAAVDAKIDADIAEAKAFLVSEGPVDARRYQSRIDTEPLRRTSDHALAALRACRDRIKAVQIRIDTGRSLSALVRSEHQLGGVS